MANDIGCKKRKCSLNFGQKWLGTQNKRMDIRFHNTKSHSFTINEMLSVPFLKTMHENAKYSSMCK